MLAAWSGLGYYRRARMLHAAAQEVVKKHGGKFPNNVQELRRLAGIGRYTAAAIASIAFGEAAAVVDGNVERVLDRVTGKILPGEERWRLAEDLLSRKRPGDFNQAMMELGATVCLPRQPMCLACPVFAVCRTRGELRPLGKKAAQKKREIYYSLDCWNGSVLLVKRPPDVSLMPGMWELPEISPATLPPKAWLTLRHSITVTDYVVRVRQGTVAEGDPPEMTRGKWVARSRLNGLALTGLARKDFARRADHLKADHPNKADRLLSNIIDTCLKSS